MQALNARVFLRIASKCQSELIGKPLKATYVLFIALYSKATGNIQNNVALCKVQELQPEHKNVKFDNIF